MEGCKRKGDREGERRKEERGRNGGGKRQREGDIKI